MHRRRKRQGTPTPNPIQLRKKRKTPLSLDLDLDSQCTMFGRKIKAEPTTPCLSDRSTVTPRLPSSQQMQPSPRTPDHPLSKLALVASKRTSSLGTQTEGFLSITNSSRNKRKTSLTNENNKPSSIATLLEKLSKFDINDGAEDKEIISIISQQ